VLCYLAAVPKFRTINASADVSFSFFGKRAKFKVALSFFCLFVCFFLSNCVVYLSCLHECYMGWHVFSCNCNEDTPFIPKFDFSKVPNAVF